MPKRKELRRGRMPERKLLRRGRTPERRTCPMLEAWQIEIEQILNSQSSESCTGEAPNNKTEYQVIEKCLAGFVGLQLVRDPRNDCVYVSKQLTNLQSGLDEAKFLLFLNAHPHVNTLTDMQVIPNPGDVKLVLFLQYCENGSLYNLIKTKHGMVKSGTNNTKWLKQLLSTLKDLHSQDLVHGDIKSLNLFVDNVGDIIFGDFGLAQWSNAFGACEEGLGTVYYMPPEQYWPRKKKYKKNMPSTKKSDVWLLGGVLHELLTVTIIFKPMAELVAIGVCGRQSESQRKSPRFRPDDLPYEIRDQCLTEDVGNRPTAQKLYLTMLERLAAQ